MDVDDVLAATEAGVVDGSLTVTDGARMIGATGRVRRHLLSVHWQSQYKIGKTGLLIVQSK